MASVYGEKMKVSLFGESHGKAVGCVIDGLPAGLSLDTSFIEKRLKERQNGAICLKPYSRQLPPDSRLYDSPHSEKGRESNVHPGDVDLFDAVSTDFSNVLTSRAESTQYTVLGGLSEKGVCLGSPLAVYFENRDIKRNDYEKLSTIYRPGHADYVSAAKSGGFADLSGGGHFSGRLTAPLVFAGAICEQLLAQKGIFISATVERIGPIDLTDTGGAPSLGDTHDLRSIRESGSTSDAEDASDSSAIKSKFGLLTELFRKLDETRDSVGCRIGVRIDGVPLGIGAPFFDTLEGEIAKAVLAVPGVKGIEFGTGFEFASKRGSEVVDAFVISREEGNETPKIVTDHNHNGGINGGISNGMPITFSVAVKPASSIGIPIRTLNFETMREDVLVTGGRHDRCIGLRALVGIASAVAIVLANQIK